MNVKTTICSNCVGQGYVDGWTTVEVDDKTGICTMRRAEVPCAMCNGKGYTEYAVFSAEEAKVILKHCGLDTES